MRYGKLSSDELQQVIDLYIKERNSIVDLISLEEYCEKYLRQCGDCHKILSVNEPEDDLRMVRDAKGVLFRCCDECYKESDEYREEMRNKYYV